MKMHSIKDTAANAAPNPLPPRLFEDPAVLARLRGPIHRMSHDFQDREELLVEGQIYLSQHESELPIKTVSFLVMGAVHHLQDLLRLGSSIDSSKRQRGRGQLHEESDDASSQADEADLDDSSRSVTSARDIFRLLYPQLLPFEKLVLTLGIEGYKRMEIARKLHVSHRTVRQHQLEIAAVARRLGIRP